MFYIINLSQDRSNINYYLSNTLLDNIKRTLDKNSKVILYLNKRGMFSSLVCKDCAYLYKCSLCDTSLTVHKNPDRLLCHLCSSSRRIPIKCDKCKGNNLEKIGVGTGQIEGSLRKIFTNKNIYRFDIDNLKNKGSKASALNDLHKADIIIGTKMITTGFDFQNVGLIGIILLEQELNIPKYNVEEKVYLNIKQLIGRGERRGEETDIFIQTFIPENEMIKNIGENNYKHFFTQTLKERKIFNYPPFCEMITLEYRDKNKDKAKDFIERIKNKLNILNIKNKFEITLIPEPRKKFNSYHYKIVIKGKNIRNFLEGIKPEIMKNSKLVVIFE